MREAIRKENNAGLGLASASARSERSGRSGRSDVSNGSERMSMSQRNLLVEKQKLLLQLHNVIEQEQQLLALGSDCGTFTGRTNQSNRPSVWGSDCSTARSDPRPP